MSDTAAALIVQAGTRWAQAVVAWVQVEELERITGAEQPDFAAIARRASDEAEETIAAALDAGAMVAALLLRGIPAQAIAAGMARRQTT